MNNRPIYFVVQGANLGGTEHATLLMMKEMIRRGYSVSLFSITPMGLLKELLDSAHIPYFDNHYRGPFGLWSLPKLCWKLWCLPKGNIITVGHNLSLFLALFFQRHHTPLLSIHFHHEGVMSKWSWRIIYLLAWMKFEKIHFVSQFILDEALKIAPWLKNKAVMMYNIIQLPSLEEASVKRSTFRDRFEIPQNAFVVGNAGQLIPRKRWDIFLETAAKVLEKMEVHFVIAGGGPERILLETKAAKISNGNKVIHFTDLLVDISGFYNGIDLLLFNSDFDAFPNTPLEAMSYGKIVVASIRRSGLCEIFPDGVGLLLREHNCNALAEAVLEYVSSSDDKKELVQHTGRLFVKNNFSPEMIGNDFLSIVNAVN
jgi:glycosyltransferase involved in cell wall biosynthesis